MKQLSLFLLAVLLLTACLTEAKRSLGRGSTNRGSSSSNTVRRTTAVSHATHRPVSYNSHHQNSAPSQPIGWNTHQNKAVGPPPAYSAHNPSGGAHTNLHEKPPSYAAPPAYPGAQQTTYPKVNTGVATGVGSGTHYNSAQNRNTHATAGHLPRNGTYGGGVTRTATVRPVPANPYPHASAGGTVAQPKYYSPNNAPSTGYHPAGSIPTGYHPAGSVPGYHPAGGSHYPVQSYHPPPNFQPHSPPLYAGTGVQPGYYPSGQFPQQKTGIGAGTAGIGGVLLGGLAGYAIAKNTGGGGGGYTQHQQPNADPSVIIINNTPGQPPQVITADGHQPTIINNGQAVAPGPAPVQGVAPPLPQPEAPVPLAPFQPGSTQVQAMPPPMYGGEAPMNAGVAPPLIHSPNPSGNAPLAPINGTDPAAAPPPPTGGVYCTPVLVNVTSETDPTNVTTIEQVACYEVPADFNPNAPPQQPNGASAVPPPLQSDLSQMGQANGVTQKSSTASLAESTQIKQSGADGQFTIWSTVTSTIVAVLVAYCLH